MARIECVSNIDGNGYQYILVFRKEPRVNDFGLWEGGDCFSFDIDHKKQETRIYSFRWVSGVPSRFVLLKILKDEIIDPCETIKLIDKLK